MSASVLYMSMSLDGYVAGPNDSPSNPGGDRFMRLHEWYGFGPHPGPGAEAANPHGRRFLEPARIELAIVRVIDTPEATHIRYRVRR